ncbi:MAG: hypothetical protein JSR15_08610 [Proteobacteria bacterium]|nr:hypothetical protein [Pseudomonadota bacterium]
MPRQKNQAQSIAPGSAGDISALARALAPVAKLCMKSGMGAGELQIAAKIACIGEAAKNARLGNRLNHSRIAAATGLTRKDVRALAGLVKSGKISAGREVAKQRTTRVLHGWRTDPEYLDRRGHPVRLAIRGPNVSFHSLVRRYGGDVTPVSVLNELVRSGAVSRAPGGHVVVKKHSPRVRGFGSDVVAEFTARLRDLGNTLVNNIEDVKHPIFVGFSEIKNLSPDEAALFQETFSERAASLVDGVERWRTSQARIRAKDRKQSAEGTRVGMGVYLVEQPPVPIVEPAKRQAQRRTSARRIKNPS